MTTEYLSVKQVAERLGITQGALLSLNMPTPDATIGRTRGWLPETIDEWNRNRPGRGVGGGRPRKRTIPEGDGHARHGWSAVAARHSYSTQNARWRRRDTNGVCGQQGS